MERLATNSATLREILAPLYCRFPGELEPQGAYIEITTRTRELTADYSGEIGFAIPMSVYHGQVIRIPVTPYLNGAVLADLLDSDEVQALAGRVCDGHSIEWDGNNNVGVLTDDASAALGELGEYLDEYTARLDTPDIVSVWECSDWVQSAAQVGITPDTSDEEIKALAAECEAEVSADFAMIDGNMEQHLLYLRDQLKDAETDS